MKNIAVVLGIVVSLSIVGCAKDTVMEVNPNEAIAFRALSQSATKATAVESAQIREFKVYARASNTAYNGYNFDDTYGNSQEGENDWASRSGAFHYWPSDESQSLIFVAHSPADLNSAFELNPVPTMTVSETSIHTVRPKVHARDHVDLLVARTTKSKTQADEAGGTVALQFQHAMTQIEVYALCENNKMTVEVVGVKLGNVRSQGKLTIPNTESAMSQVWSNVDNNGKRSYVAGGTSSTVVPLNSSEQSIMGGEGSFMIIPQTPSGKWDGTASNSDPYIAVLCRIWQSDGNGGRVLLFPTSASKYAYAAVGVNTQWLVGRKYKYTLKFFSGTDGGAGLVPPELDDPSVDGGDSNIDKTPQPGDNVVGGAISVDVEVQGWPEDATETTPVL